MPSSSSHQLNPGERPPFTFCEPVWASGHGLWCIRKTTEKGPKFGGGVDTPSLCGRVTPEKNGWDLEVRLTEHHLRHNTCPKCLAKYRLLQAYAILVELASAPSSFQDEFVRYFSEQTGDPLEWRFQGTLGSGGKFWRSAGRHYVNCYPEDVTPEREKLITAINERIAQLPIPG